MADQYRYGGKQYVGGEGRTGVLDKNYYADLGFSTSKGAASKTRGQLEQFGKDVAARGGEIDTYTGKLTKARSDLEKKVANAWDDTATSTVTLGPTTWRVPKEAAIGLRESLSKVFHSSNPVPAGDLTLEEYKKKYAQDINLAAGLGAIRSYAAGKFRELPTEEMPAEGTRQYDQYMAEKKKRDDAEAAAQKKFDEVAPTVYAQAKALNDQDSLNFTFDYRTSSKNRAKYYAVVNQVNPQISKMKLNYMKQYADAAAPYFDELTSGQVKAQEAKGVLEQDIAQVEGSKQAIAEKQQGQREGMAQTFNSLFRQRGNK